MLLALLKENFPCLKENLVEVIINCAILKINEDYCFSPDATALYWSML